MRLIHRIGAAITLMLLTTCSGLAQQAVTFNNATQPVTTPAVEGPHRQLVNVNDTATVNAAGQNGIGAWFTSGSFTGTVVAECTMDGGATWTQTYFDNPNTATTSTLMFAAPPTAQQVSIMPMGGCDLYRVRVTVATSGSLTAALRATTGIDPSVLFTAPFGANVLPPALAIVGGVDSSGIPRAAALTSTGAVMTATAPGLPLPLCNALIRYNCQR